MFKERKEHSLQRQAQANLNPTYKAFDTSLFQATKFFQE